MSRSFLLSRLHRLINDSVRPYTEAELVSLTKEKEKALLASLSQLLRQIQLWTRELDIDSNYELGTQSEDHHYLSNIISDLVFFLTLKSRYVPHLSGNILVAISDFLVTSGSNWDIYIHLLCLCMELVVNSALSFSSAHSTAGLRNSQFNSTSFLIVVKPRLKNAGWSTSAEIVRVLRNMLKCLNPDCEDENLAKVYLNSMHSCLSNLPWDSMDMISSTQNSFSGDALGPRTLDEEGSRVVFMGNLLQLLCSMVEQCGFVHDSSFSPDKHSILGLITNLVPKLFYQCLRKQGDVVISISQYFRHKLLVLMIRLSFQFTLGCCILVLWFHLLHNYFQELLWEPIFSNESVHGDALEGSPFLLSNSDGEVYTICSRHLQRQAVFLFLRCCFSLINQRDDTKKHFACVTADSCLTLDPDLENSKSKGLLELYKWLQGHLHLDTFVDYEMYTENCMTFSLSFLRLFMHEDDVLFKVLLQLLNLPFCVDQKIWKSQDVKEDILFHVSNVFNAVHLFHLFLAELHYDHQVLLDYLISKDTGIDCAEYLLRCLRLVSNSWPMFVKFSLGEKITNKSSDKKRLMVTGSSNDQCRQPCKALKNILPLHEECKSDLEYGYEHYLITGSHYKKAKECLLSLKTSVENLHQKNLFLYNPEVLLKRLIGFQELCSKQDDHNNSKYGGPV